MATTYNPNGLTAGSVSLARFILGDRGVLKDPSGAAVWLLQDEEIQAMVGLWGFAEGVAQCADALAVQFAQEPDAYEDEAGAKVSWKDRVAAWKDLAARLRAGLVRTQEAGSGTPLHGVTTGPDMRYVPPRDGVA